MKRNVVVLIGLLLTTFFVYIVVGNTGSVQFNEINPAKMKEVVADFQNESKIDSIKNASITSTQLIITDGDENQQLYDLPDDEFFLAVAPYIEVTHPCETHSLTSCQGELVNKTFDVKIEDEKGTIVMDDTLSSQSNGFIDLWLPRNQTYDVTIEYDGKVAKTKVSTFENDNTCLTTPQLM